MTVLSTLLHWTNYRSPFLRTLVPSVALAYGIQTAFAIPSIVAQSERLYDLSGSLTYLSCTALSLYLPAIRTRVAARALGKGAPDFPGPAGAVRDNRGQLRWNWRQMGLSLAVGLWATRHEDILVADLPNERPGRRAADFQATWVSIVLLPVLALNSLPVISFSSLPTAIAVTDIVGTTLWTSGFALEVIADRQKAAWNKAKKEKRHDEDFLASGLYSKSRFPNYFGESTLWTGAATLAAGVLSSNAGQIGMGIAGWGIWGKIMTAGLAFASPAFTTFLLLKVSGIPLSEGKYDMRYGDREDYQIWKRDVPRFFSKLW